MIQPFRLKTGKKAMGAFLVATLVILVLIFIMFMLLGLLKQSVKESPDLINFVNRNYFKKDLITFLDAPLAGYGKANQGISMAEFAALHFTDLESFAKEYDINMDFDALSDDEKTYYVFFTQGSKLARQFNDRHLNQGGDACAFEISTYIDNDKQEIVMPLDVGRLRSTLVETRFSGPDGRAYVLRSRCTFNVENEVLGDLH